MQTIRKDPLRVARYLSLLLVSEVIRGNAAKRRRFIGRIANRVFQKLKIYQALSIGYMAAHAVRCVLLPPEMRQRLWRSRRWYWATAALNNRDYLRNWLGHRYEGGPKVVVLGMGSIGDTLQITPVLRALREKLPTAQIALLHRSPAASYVLNGNDSINSVGLGDFFQFDQIKRSIAEEGTADLAVEIQSVNYVVTYTRAPAGQRHPELERIMPDSFFSAAEAALAFWTKYPPVFPRKNGQYAWPEEWRGHHYIDMMGATGNLPISRNSDLEFHIGEKDREIVQTLPQDQPIITVQYGVDADVINWARATGQHPTKLAPLATWVDMVRLLRAKGFAVVQLGMPAEEPIEGVTLDLRGKTSLREAAAILEYAAGHVGIEGGLVNMARAMKTKCVVMYGPTSADFFGYPQNANLTAGECNSCWWAARDWYIYCPRGLAEAECMHAYKPQAIIQALLALVPAAEREKYSVNKAAAG